MVIWKTLPLVIPDSLTCTDFGHLTKISHAHMYLLHACVKSISQNAFEYTQVSTG